MIKIGIDLNGVLRDNLSQLEYVYNKYQIGDEVDLSKTPIESLDLIKYFPIDGGIDRLNKFMYEEAALEIFGHADETYNNIINNLNLYYIDLVDDEVFDITIVSREAINSIPASYFFLSKTGCRIPNIKFVTEYSKIWDGIDVLITANPTLLKSKPNDKTTIKINSNYNKGVISDYESNSLHDLMLDDNIYKMLKK